MKYRNEKVGTNTTLGAWIAFVGVLCGVFACGTDGTTEDIGGTTLALVKYGHVEAGGDAPGQLQGAFGVDDFGQSNWTLPLSVPPGRAGLAPGLTLGYSSAARNGVFGVGFSLQTGESVIARCGQTVEYDDKAMAIQFDENDRLCLDGSRLVLTNDSANYWADDAEYRVADGSSVSVRWASDGIHEFEVRGRDGTRLLYGGESNSTVYANHSDRNAEGNFVSTSKSDLEWHVARVEDPSGNYMQYIYDALHYPNGAFDHLLFEIHYTGAAGRAPNRVIHFDYIARGRPELFFLAGTERQLGHLTRSIKMSVRGTLVREYEFVYESGTRGDRLDTITECDRFSICRQPTEFSWTETTVESLPAHHLDLPPNWGINGREQTLEIADLDGDGFDDLVGLENIDGAALGIVVRMNIPDLETPAGPGDGYGGTTGGSLADERAPQHRRFAAPIDTGIRPNRWAPNVLSIGIPFSFTITDLDQDGRDEILVRQNIRPGADDWAETWDMYDWEDGAVELREANVLDCESGPYLPFIPLVADFDGDGASDLLGSCAPIGTATESNHRLVSFSWDAARDGVETPWTSSSLGNDTLYGWNVTVDLDGDGQTELVSVPWFPSDTATLPTPDTGLAAVLPAGTDASLLAPVYLPTVEGDIEPSYVFVDINGDGLRDAFTTDHVGGPLIRLNTGRGFGPAYMPFDTPPAFVDRYLHHTATNVAQVGDFDHDGREDLLLAFGSGAGAPPRVVLHLSRGTRFEVFELELPGDSNVGPNTSGHALNFSHIRLLDADADGQLEYTQIRDGKLEIRTAYVERGDLLHAVDDGGQEPTFTYYTQSNAGCGEVYPRVCAAPGWATAEVQQHLGRADFEDDASPEQLHATKYYLEGGLVDVRRRRHLGYSHRVQTDDMGPTLEIEYDQSIVDPSGRSLTPFAGLPLRITRSTLDRTVEQWTHYDLQQDVQAESAYRILTRRTGETVIEAGATLHSVRTENTHDDWGTLTDSFFQDTLNPSEYSLEHFEIENRPEKYLIGLVHQHTLTHSIEGETQTQTVEFAYDDKGRLDKTTTEPFGSASEYLEVNRVFDSYGNVVQIIASDLTGETREQAFSYGTDSTFVRRATNALGHVTRFRTDRGLGVVLDSTRFRPGIRGAAVSASDYDGFGRLLRNHHDDDLIDTTEYRVDEHEFAVTSRAASGEETEQVFDRSGRLRQIRRRYGRGIYDINQQDLSYDSLGRLARRSNWHRDSLSTHATNHETFSYDEWSRPLKHTNLDGGETAWAYSGRTTTTTNPRGGEIVVVRNSLGRVSSRTEPLTPAAYAEQGETSYVYGPFGRLRETRLLGDTNVTTQEYDVLGRLIQQVDMDAGTDSMQYNAFGELRSRVNAVGETQEFGYDALGRVVHVLDNTVGESTFTYDTAPGFGLGQIAEATSEGAKVLYEYDNVGRPVRVEQSTGSATLYAETSYDAATGRRSAMTVPRMDGGEIDYSYSYSEYGELNRIRFGGSTVWQVFDREDPLRRSTSERRGPMHVKRDYDRDTHHMRSYTADAAELIAARESYQYGQDGRLEQFAELGGFSQTFEYDKRGRLTDWQRGSTNVVYEYDALGNQTRGASGLREFGAETGPHAVIRSVHTGEKFEYDAAGRREASSEGWYAKYTAFDLPMYVEEPNGQWRAYSYDAFSQRVTEWRPDGVQVQTFGELLTLSTLPSGKGTLTYAVYADGQRVAEMTLDHEGTWTERYLNSDQVGSSLAWADASGHRHEVSVTEPFGAAMTGNPNEQRFASHAFDAALGLVNAKGRIYDPVTAAFLTADPVRIPTATHMNLYGYSASDPVNFYDPDGFQPAPVPSGSDSGGDSSVTLAQPFQGPVFGAPRSAWAAGRRTNRSRYRLVNQQLSIAQGPAGATEDEDSVPAGGVLAIDYVGYLITTPVGRLPLGHYAIAAVFPNGRVRYFEYGRYDQARIGLRGRVRELSRGIRRLRFGDDGYPTERSMQRLLGHLSNRGRGGHGVSIVAAYYSGADPDALVTFATQEHYWGDFHLEDYNIFVHSCFTFCNDGLMASLTVQSTFLIPRTYTYTGNTVNYDILQ